MKIISKFKDYYDRALALGQDERIPYVRLTERRDTGTLDPPAGPTFYHWGGSFKNLKTKINDKPTEVRFGRSTVWICGKAYRYVYAAWSEGVPTHYSHVEGWRSLLEHREYFYTFDQLSKFVESHGFLVKDICGENVFGERSRYAETQAYLSSQGTTEAEQYLVEKRIVTLRLGYDGSTYPPSKFWELDFPLRDIQFFKLMDPYQIYQELDMYVTGVLGQQTKEVIKISDKDRIYQHGFDKYSFRKMPEEGKRKK